MGYGVKEVNASPPRPPPFKAETEDSADQVDAAASADQGADSADSIDFHRF